MKVEELRGLAVEELQDKVTGLKKSLMELRFQSKTGKLETKNSIKSTRRDVARIMTIMNEQKRQPVEGVKKSAPVKKQKVIKAAPAEKTAAKKPAKKISAKTSKK